MRKARLRLELAAWRCKRRAGASTSCTPNRPASGTAPRAGKARSGCRYCSGPLSACGSAAAASPRCPPRAAPRLLARGAAADAALLDLAVVDAARFLGEALADVLGVLITWRTACSHATCSVRALASPRCVSSLRGRARAEVQARRARQASDRRVAAHRAFDQRRARPASTKSSSEANQPSKRWSCAQRRLRTFMPAIMGDGAPAVPSAIPAPSGRFANSATTAGRSGVFASVSSPRLRKPHQARRSVAVVDVEKLAGDRGCASPASRPRANQTSMPSVE